MEQPDLEESKKRKGLLKYKQCIANGVIIFNEFTRLMQKAANEFKDISE
jgi:hypothetical protein